MDIKKKRLIINGIASLILAFFVYLSISSLSKTAFSYGVSGLFRQSIFLFYVVLAILSLIFLIKEFYWAKITGIVSTSGYGTMFGSNLMIQILSDRLPVTKSLVFYVILSIIGIILISFSIKIRDK